MNFNNNYHSTLSQCREEKDDETLEENENDRLLRSSMSVQKPVASATSSTSSSRTDIVPEEEQIVPLQPEPRRQKSIVLMPNGRHMSGRHFDGLQRKNTHSLTVPRVREVDIL